ncbi:M15 family metallopeptidase [Clostridium algidicarnis]|uniref:D-alanyl-D-alanine dipeptidase n=2 Tax=Clostridium algidicarnis TaxID=37659 RepID=A0A2S6FVV5_9CLOT|nr:M15 family metallopeptidase [Clostridium algidicarnis]MBB6631942.1 M15 family metallopeptidase [Clostridium algidicarnis]MBB6698285.1 M15 family metallopeptidase [Clostridium algidicarnis]MBU3194470.1 M15 family metallopeptidase [Clostridium algidicarnis]MBU3197412.1 M15 family metallopeptidase [Clostridium algidicarnis]MBU3205250.1 M15 family metallopeptidase [Clostridium algidicarnis]
MKLKNTFIIIILYLILIFLGYAIGYSYKNIDSIPIKSEVSTNKIDRTLKEPEIKIVTGDIDYTKDLSGLVPINISEYDFVLDLRYATDNNFTGKKVYDAYVAVLQKDTLNKLISANEDFKALGYRIKIWDAYRPGQVQEYFWSIVQDRRYIASPYYNGSRHNRGTAVDLTLVDSKGKELEMPTGFDEFNTTAYRNAVMTNSAKKNVDLLTEVMVKNGFSPIETEWWHFDDINADNYPIQNYPLSKFLVNVN